MAHDSDHLSLYMGKAVFPLSSVQKDIFFDQLLYPGLPLYNIGGYCAIDAALDPHLFEEVLCWVVARHEALRLVFIPGDKGTVQHQRALAYWRPDVRLLDFSLQENPHTAALEWMNQRFRVSFELFETALVEFALLRLTNNRYYWFLRAHHLILDGWSLALLNREVIQTYQRLHEGKDLEDLPPTYYRRFVAQDRVYHRSPNYTRDLEYWASTFADLPEPLLSPRRDRQLDPVMAQGEQHSFTLDRSFYQRIQETARTQGVTTFQFFLTATYIYFARTRNRDALALGLPVLNRSGVAFKRKLGCFAGMIPSLFTAGRLSSVAELTKHIGTTLRRDYRHQRLPLGDLSRKLGLHHIKGRRLYYVSFSFMEHDYDASVDGREVNVYNLTPGYHQDPLAIVVREFHGNADIGIDFDYNLSWFSRAQIQQLEMHYKCLLASMVERPNTPVYLLDLLPEEERSHILSSFAGDGLLGFDLVRPIVAHLEHWAQTTPEKTAVELAPVKLNYAILNRTANQLAHLLVQKGVGPMIRIGISLSRSPSLIAAMLAVQKVGAVFVPIDPSYPAERIAFFIADAQPKFLITARNLDPKGLGPERIFLEELDLASFPCDNPGAPTIDLAPAYLIYTSGSTGTPKGVLVPYRNLAWLVGPGGKWRTLGPDDSTLQMASINFDAALEEIFTTIVAGARLVLRTDQDLTPVGLCALCERESLTLIDLPTSFWNLLVKAIREGSVRLPQSVRVITVAGEAVSPVPVQKFLETGHAARLINSYGPTETTISSHYWNVESPFPSGEIPIGAPLDGARSYVLDPSLGVQPIDCPGEIFIGGNGVSMGYLNQPGLTASRFIPDPFSSTGGQRLYRTGDLGRWLPDGNLVFQGRVDHQVKLRGFRIELGEIESALHGHSLVGRAAVILHQPGEDSTAKMLVAYVEMEGELPDFRAFLSDRLPEFMLPSQYIALPRFPLLPNGKIDRRNLPSPDTAIGGDFTAPRNDLERRLYQLWSEVLEIDQFGIHANFFELGGHSLLATQLISRIRESFGVELSMRVIFDTPTISGLAPILDAAVKKARDSLALVPKDNAQSPPLSFAQSRLWFLCQLEGPSATYNMFVSFRLEGLLDLVLFRRAMEEVVLRHETLRTRFIEQGGQPTLSILPSAPVDLYCIDLTSLSVNYVASVGHALRLMADEQQRPFDLSSDTLLRVRLLFLDVGRQFMTVCMHHIISDGWSVGVFISEIVEIYTALLRNRSPLLKPLPIQYSDFAYWQKAWLSGEMLTNQRSYWTHRLAQAPALLELPTDKPRPPSQSFNGAWLLVSIPDQHKQACIRICQKYHTSYFMVLLANYAILLSKYSRQTHIAVGTPIANRTRAEIEGLIGFFVNMLVMVTEVKPSLGFRDLLESIRTNCLDDYDNQDFPFEHLVEILQPERKLSYSPLFQAMFVLQNAPLKEINLPGLKLEPIPQTNTTSKFDLSLSLEETDRGFEGYLEYATDLFEPESIDRFWTHFLILLEEATQNPEQPIAALSLLSAEDLHTLVNVWNDPHAAFPQKLDLGRRFQQTVARFPERLALVSGNQQFTYRELLARASLTALHLRTLGVGVETPVALAMPRNASSLVGLLGTLLAGGTYLAFNLSYPPERLAFMATDAVVGAVLVCDQTRNLLVDLSLPRLNVDDLLRAPVPSQIDPPNPWVDPYHGAYIIYTSGTTGKPKGVVMYHRAVGRLVDATAGFFKFDEHDVWTLFSSLAFDVSVWEIWGSWLNGGRLEVVSDEVVRAPHQLFELVHRRKITVLNQVPSVFYHLIDPMLAQEGPLALRYVIFAGEALDPLRLAPIFAHFGLNTPRLINMYGITETTVHVTIYEVTAEDARKTSSLVGRAIPDQRIYLLDRDAVAQPAGVPGEIHVGGEGLARAYLGQPRLTAQRFIPDPFSVTPGGRLYKSGDLAQFQRSGDLKYLGRMDHQIKVRGFRIELGEIEAALKDNVEVKAALVQIYGPDADNQRLVAYLVHKDNPDLEAFQKGLVSQWSEIYEGTYQALEQEQDPQRNFLSWNDSLTGEPIPFDHMWAWAEEVCHRVMSLNPKCVLEIGCGSGIALFRLAPRCETYWGTDISKVALDYIRRHLFQLGPKADSVRLVHGAAHQLDDLPENTFDTIVLNSVVQYFPSLGYLESVIQECLRLLKPGGNLFLGDIRNLKLLRVFHTSLCNTDVFNPLSLDQLRARVEQNLHGEEELCLDPAWFSRVTHQNPFASHVRILVKANSFENEMTRYRYDVVIAKSFGLPMVVDPYWVEWHPDQMNIDRIGTLLASGLHACLGLEHFPDIRLHRQVQTMKLLYSLHPPKDAYEFFHQVQDLPQPDAPTFSSLVSLGAECGYRVESYWTQREESGSFDVLFFREDMADAHVHHSLLEDEAPIYANNPLEQQYEAYLTEKLKTCLATRVPEYMIPSAFVYLSSFPLTPNGKIDRRALPEPGLPGGGLSNYQAPRTSTEKVIAQQWASLLGYERVGRNDHFFDLGGHSLLATRALARINGELGLSLLVRTLFEAPTVAKLAEVVDQVRLTHIHPRIPLRKVQKGRESALSYAQRRLWFLWRLEGPSATYNMAECFSLTGALACWAMERAMHAVTARHASLRTTFHESGDEPTQIVDDRIPTLLLVDLSFLPNSEAISEDLLRREAMSPFDLHRGPLIRWRLCRLSPNKHLFLVTLHHIIGDGWSVGVLVREFMQCYVAALNSEEASLPTLPLDYVDYCHWQNAWFVDGALENQESFWKTRLAGLPSRLELPTDYARPGVQRFEGRTEPVKLPLGLLRKLECLAKEENVTLFMVLLSAYFCLLARYSHQQDVSVGSPVANRTQAELEGIIGFFVNTLVLRAELRDGLSFRALLGNVKEACVAAYDHQDVPFEYLVETLQPERSLAYTPLFQVMFVLQNTPWEEANLPGVVMNSFRPETNTSKFDLTLSLQIERDSLSGFWEYAVSLFERDTILAMNNHYSSLLTSAVDAPDVEVWRLPLMDESDSEMLLYAWNQTSRDWGPFKCVHEVFTETALRMPEASALVFGESRTSYQTLDCRANQVAWHLRALGAREESRIAVCLHRSELMIVAVLGILKAGAAYVPLDPSYPPSRLAYALEDADAKLLVTDEGAQVLLGSYRGHLVNLDRVAGQLAEQPDHPPVARIDPDHLLYVIYTSGSTGVPKGIALTHRALANLIYWHAAELETGSQVGVLQFASLSFDASFHEMFAAWHEGGTLYLITEDMRFDADRLIHYIADHPITKIIVPVIMLQQWATHYGESPELLAHVRELITTGEQLQITEPIRKLFHKLRPGVLHNHYGPAETHVVTAFNFSGEPNHWPYYASIGKAISNTTVYILDKHLAPVPQGVSGEIYLGGANLARNYLNRPSLTAEKFVPDPFGLMPGTRLYRTGDIATMKRDGNIFFQQRRDHMVKIRGFRVEPGEVEAKLNMHPSVARGVVTVWGSAVEEKRLIAYVVPESGSERDANHLRQTLMTVLPDYMVPTHFIFLNQLPLTPNGKLDKTRLPEPEQILSRSDFIAPRTTMETILAGIWEEVLGKNRVGAYDHFFELGGHSLLATRVVARIRRYIGVDLGVRLLFEEPRLASLAARLEVGTRKLGQPALVPMPPEAEAPLSFAQQRLWLINKMEGMGSAYNMPAALHLRGALNIQAFADALRFLVGRHQILRTVIVGTETPRVELLDEKCHRMEVVDLRQCPQIATQAERLLREVCEQPFDLERGPLFRVLLLILNEGEYKLLLTMHHIISDGWSISVFIRELTQAYQALCVGENPQVPSLPVQYTDFAYWQRQWLSGDALDKQVAFWRMYLDGVPPMLNLPTDRPRPQQRGFVGRAFAVALSPEQSRGLRELCRRCGVTPFMLLSSVFGVLLARYCDQSDICLGSPIANRNDPDLEHLIGLFVNTVVIRLRPSHNPSFIMFLEQMRSEILKVFAHQETPFEKVVEAVVLERDPSRNPLFQVMFALQNVPTTHLEVQRLEIWPLEQPQTTVKVDLALMLTEHEGKLQGSIEYAAELFEQSTIQRLWHHFNCLLDGLLAEPECGIYQVPLIHRSERRQLMLLCAGEPNKVDVFLPPFLRVAARSHQSPKNPAVIVNGGVINYETLHARALSFAAALRQHGLSPETPVAVMLDGFEEHAAMLGIHRVGCAYLPLDPNYPIERLRFMLEDSATPVLLARQSQHQLASELGGLSLISPESLIACADEKHNEVGAAQLAYVIYTSGTSGRPKGVALNHGGLGNLVDWHLRTFEVQTSSRATRMAGPAFDATTWEIWPYLVAGATSLPVAPELVAHSERLAAWMIDQRITHAFVPTPLAPSLFSFPWPKHTSLRWLLVGGDRLDVHPPAGLCFKVSNNYGPTENTVVTTSGLVPPNLSGSPSLGRAVTGTAVYVLDRFLGLVPVGVQGELVITGQSLGRGYLNRPGLTAERYIPNPFSNQPGTRMYLSGDLGRYHSDGDLTFLGRLDHQVKLRGYRIELAEIENALLQIGSFDNVAVLCRKDLAGSATLVAYLSKNSGEEPPISHLEAALAKTLPAYMVPAHFVFMAQMPLTPNGKLDRAALPKPIFTPSRQGAKSAIAELVGHLWADILQMEGVGPDGHFFHLGGHSITGARVLARLQEMFKIHIPLNLLFEAPTLSAFSQRLSELLRDEGFRHYPLERRSKLVEEEVSAAQRRLWLVHQLDQQDASYNVPMALRLEGALDVAALSQSILKVIARHESLRTYFSSEGTGRQIVVDAWNWLPTVVDLTGLEPTVAESQLEYWMQQDQTRPFPVSRGPLIRALVIRLDNKTHCLLMNMHHLISDGWSLSVLIEDVSAYYHAILMRRPANLPTLPVQYTDYTRWQNRWLDESLITRQQQYWQECLAGVPVSLNLPTDYVRTEKQGNRGYSVDVSLSEDLTRSLHEACRNGGVTLYMFLLAGYGFLLSYDTKQGDVLIGSPVAGRNHPFLERLIGFFLNTLVFRVQPAPHMTIAELLDQVRGMTVSAYGHQDVPFDLVLEALQPERLPGRSPLFQVWLALQNNPVARLELPGLSLSPLETKEKVAKFDLELLLEVRNNAIQGMLIYNAALFKEATMVGFVKRLTQVLEIMGSEPGLRLTELSARLDHLRRVQEEQCQEAFSSLKDKRRRKGRPAAFEI